jgi:hypothetical protein
MSPAQSKRAPRYNISKKALAAARAKRDDVDGLLHPGRGISGSLAAGPLLSSCAEGHLRRPDFAADFFGDFVPVFLETPPLAELRPFLEVLLRVRFGPFAGADSVFVALFAAPGTRFPTAFLACFAAALNAVSASVPAA